ncbi:MAG TPA: thioredoxin [Ignavibacteria bacterium]|nr:thioredoxin [Ignavibacteria bacterium]
MQFTDQNFQQEVEESKGVVLVDFFAEWCGPCKVMWPIIEELAEEYKDKEAVKIGKLNIDESQAIAQKFNVMSIPTLILFKDGKLAETLVGMQDKESLKELINKNV